MMKFIRGTLALMLLIAAASEVYAQVCTRPPDGNALVNGPSPDQLTYAHGDRVRYSCALPGYMIFGRASNFVWLRCRADGTWNKPFPCCEPISCMSPPDGINTNKVLSADRVLPGTNYTYTCMYGYQTTDPVVTTCQANGTWDVPAPNCTDICCTSPPDGINTNKVLQASEILPGTNYTYTCACGNETNDPVVTTCLANGTWDAPAPNCTAGGGGGGPCEEPWVLSDLDICYLVVTSSAVNWQQARDNCMDDGGDLATPKTNALLDDLAGVQNVASSDLWIGAGQLVNGLDSVFTWLDTTVVTQITPSTIAVASLGREMLTFTFTPSSYTLFFQDESVFRGYICQK